MIFFQVQASVLATLLVGTPIGGILLRYWGYWIPSAIGTFIAFGSMFLLIWIPTKPKKSEDRVQEDTIAVTEYDASNPFSDVGSEQNISQRLKSEIVSELLGIREVLNLLFTNPTILLGILLLMATKAGIPIQQFLPQYASKRFGWDISDVRSFLAISDILFQAASESLVRSHTDSHAFPGSCG